MKHTKGNFDTMKELLDTIWSDGELEIDEEANISFRVSNEVWQELEDFLNTAE